MSYPKNVDLDLTTWWWRNPIFIS